MRLATLGKKIFSPAFLTCGPLLGSLPETANVPTISSRIQSSVPSPPRNSSKWGPTLKAGCSPSCATCTTTRRTKNRIQSQSLDDPLTYEPTVLPSQIFSLEFGDFRRAFWQLADDRREALILIGASGFSYEEAAKVCGCPKGTIKSRISRARRELLQILEDGLLADRRRRLADDGRLRRGFAGRQAPAVPGARA